jgi:hypothetical protein
MDFDMDTEDTDKDTNMDMMSTQTWTRTPPCTFKDSNVGYRISIKFYSDIRQNIGLRRLQSDIRQSSISFITDIGLSAHLCVTARHGGVKQ